MFIEMFINNLAIHHFRVLRTKGQSNRSTALVLALQLDAVAHGARVTMVKSFSSSDTAEPAFIAMEYLSPFITGLRAS